MKTKVIVGLVCLAVVAGIGWKVNSLFEKTVDWPLMVLAGKADAEQAMASQGTYENLPSEKIHDMLAARGVADRYAIDVPEKGFPTVVLSKMSERSCLGLQNHPALRENFLISVDGGTCTEGAVLRFKVK